MKSIREIAQTSTILSKIQEMTAKNDDGSPKTCKACGSVMFNKDNRIFCWHCETIAPEDKQLAKETEDAHELLKTKKQIDRFKKYSLIPAKLENANFENYFPQQGYEKEQGEALATCKEYADTFNPDEPKNLVIYGPWGTGKSHLAKSITDIVMAKDYTSLFITLPKLITKLRATWNRNSDLTEFDVLQIIETVKVLVLDDVGAELTDDMDPREKARVKAKLFEIFDSRAGRATVITMNLTPKQFLETYGERDASRLLQDADLLKIPGNNYRMRKFYRE